MTQPLSDRAPEAPPVGPAPGARRVLMVLHTAFPPDTRVENEIRALRDAGHTVHVAAPGRDGAKPEESRDGYQIHRPSGPAWARRLGLALRLLAFLDPYWLLHIRRLVRRYDIDVLHVHDLPLLRTAQVAAPRGCRVVADLHENYPVAVGSYVPSRALLRRYRGDRARWERLERRALRRCDAVVCVVEEMRDRLATNGVPTEAVTVVENTEDLTTFDAQPIEPGVLPAADGAFTIMYVGGLQTGRGLETMILGMPAVRAAIPGARLVLVGGGGPYEDDLRALAREHGVEEALHLAGWHPFRELPSLIAASDVCASPLDPSEQNDATMGRKIFQYMALAKPVIVSSCRPLARIVGDTGAGLVFDAGDPASFAARVLELRDPALRERMGAAGESAVRTRYNWAVSSRALSDVYAALPPGRPGR